MKNIFETEFSGDYVNLELTMALSSRFLLPFSNSWVLGLQVCTTMLRLYSYFDVIVCTYYFHKHNCYWLVADLGRTIKFTIAHSLHMTWDSPQHSQSLWKRQFMSITPLLPEITSAKSQIKAQVAYPDDLGSKFISSHFHGSWGKTYSLGFVSQIPTCTLVNRSPEHCVLVNRSPEHHAVLTRFLLCY